MQITHADRILQEPLVSTKEIVVGGAIWAALYICQPSNFLQTIGLAACTALVGSFVFDRSEQPIRSWVIKKQANRMISNKIWTWERAYGSFVGSNEGKQLKAPSIDYCTWDENQRESKNKNWNTSDEFRLPVIAAAIKLMDKIFTQHVPTDSQLLEIGSNIVNAEGLTCLSRLLPKKYLKNLTYSDYFQDVVGKESKTQHSYQMLDIRNPSKNLFNTKDCIVALNVLDVISRRDLLKVAEGVYQLLKNQGKFIVLADRPIELTPLVAKFSESDQFVIPWTKDASLNLKATLINGVKVIPMKTIQTIFDSLNDQYQPFLRRIINLSPAQRQHFFLTSFFNGDQLCEFLQSLIENRKDVESFERCESYQKDVSSAFTSKKFKILFSGYMKESDIIDHDDLGYERSEGIPYNQSVYDLRNGGPLVANNVDNIQHKKMEVETHFHVMIFQKQSDD